MRLEFLRPGQEPKIVRTTLYGDQDFGRWELEILHTPIMQRLYNLKQLGFADRVFPDAVHARLNHVIGVAEVAARMAQRLEHWLRRNADRTFKFAREQPGTPRTTWPIETISAGDLADRVKQLAPMVRMIGFLHDLTHAAFGHTLEDEVCVFVEKHDDPRRQGRFFDALIAQLVYSWAIELRLHEPDPDVVDRLCFLEVDRRDVLRWTEEVSEAITDEERVALVNRLQQLELALSLLLRIEYLHESGQDTVPVLERLLVTDVIGALEPRHAGPDLVVHRDAFFVDIVGNTICADLLDYARRDPHNAGLRVQFDDRLLRYVCAVSVQKQLSPTGTPCIRLAMQFFTDKMRHDVLSEMSGILKARYLITERVLFHPTKCAAGAMLGTAVQLLGLTELPPWVQVLGDVEFLRLMVDLANRLAADHSAGNTSASAGRGAGAARFERLVVSCRDALSGTTDGVRLDVAARIKGARVLLWRLMSRRFPKPVFRLRSGIKHGGKESDETIAAAYVDSARRFELERAVELECNLPPGTVVIHCPKRKMSMKVAQALVVGNDPSKAAHLRNVDDVSPEDLTPYRAEIQAVESMYRAIWQFHAFLDSSHYDKKVLVSESLRRKLNFPNDHLLERSLFDDESENVYTLTATKLSGSFGWNDLPPVIRRLDTEQRRLRLGGAESAEDRARRIIEEVRRGVADADVDDRQLPLIED